MSLCNPGDQYLGRDNDGTPLCKDKYGNVYQGGGGNDFGGGGKKPPPPGWHYENGKLVRDQPGGGGGQQGGGYQGGGGQGSGGGGGGGGAGGGYFFSDNYGNHYSQNGYSQLVGTYKHLADIFGVTLTPGMMHALAKNGVGQDELRFRLNMVRWVESSKDMREQFQGVLDWKYGAGKFDVSSDKGALAFGTMRSERQVYQVWQQFAADAAGKLAGFSTEGVGTPASNPDLSLTQGQQSDFIKSLGLSPDQIDINQLEPIYQQAAQWALENLPDVRWKGENYALDKPELLQLAAGRGDVRQKEALTRLINEHQAFDQARAEPTAQQTSSGDVVLAGFGGLTG